SETTWHALRAQLEGAAVAHPGRIVVRARSRRVAGMALAGALIPAAIAAIVLLPARNPRSTTIVSNPAPADHPLAVADRFLAVISDALARPAQVEEIAVHPAASASASHPARPNSTGFRPEYVRTMHSDSNSYWPGRALRQRADRIQQLHRQAPQDTSSHLKLASAAQVDRPQEASSALYSALDPLPAPSEQPRQYIIDMVNLSPSTPTLASNPQDSKDQTIW
ncbi:MAG TPA: hypothetical protein VKT32_06190, partial [Chthonomonadaceae bacterium]|nr:hypothetical protein [Chthonomonadaceae bacterium]